MDAGDALIFEGRPDSFTFADLLRAAETMHTGRFMLHFDDGGSGPDRDYNDFIATINLADLGWF